MPVAGADRLALAEHMPVSDLMALGRAILLPEDDLNLACLLKSPLLGLDEDELFELAYGRGRLSLIERLRGAAPARSRALWRRLRAAGRAGWSGRTSCRRSSSSPACWAPDGGRAPAAGPPGPRGGRADRGVPGQALAYEQRPSRLPGGLPPLAGAGPATSSSATPSRRATRSG